jgi:error-prone DNA polymerase
MGRHVDSAIGPTVWDRTHRTLLDAPAVLLDGHIERDHDVVNVVVHHAHTVDQPQT